MVRAETQWHVGWMLHRDVTGQIIGSAMTVLNELKPGLAEKVYENALVLELRARGRLAEQQRGFDIEFRGQRIGRLVPELIVDGLVVVETKVVTTFNDSHVAQMIGYLNITRLSVALLLNFKEATLEWKRIVR